VVKLVAIIIGLLLTGLAYLQYQQIALINWGELEGASEAIVNALVSTMTKMFNSGHQDVAELGYNKLWYSYDKQYVYWNRNWRYERVRKNYEQTEKHNK
jgi:hypothetical protein